MNLHAFKMKTLTGKDCDLGDYAGKVCLVVNVASECGLTPQYEGLQKLYDERKDDGLVVLGFPCNQFGGQEPGDAAAIEQFCSMNYGVSFPMFAKIDVNGKQRDPLYAWLTSVDAEPEGSGDIAWNFGKFVIGKDGEVVGRFHPKVTPDDSALMACIESALKA